MPSANGTNGNGTNGHAPETQVAIGRPTTYHPEFCASLLAWFEGDRTERVIKKQTEMVLKDGSRKVEVEYAVMATRFPTFEGYAESIGHPPQRLLEWRKVHPEFREAYARARGKQKDWLIELGMKGCSPPPFAMFLAKNATDMRDEPVDATQGDRKTVFFFDPMRASRGIAAPSGEPARVSG